MYFPLILTIATLHFGLGHRQLPPNEPKASNVFCKKVVSINSLDGVLYKPENEHGKRNFTFIVQNVVERPGKRSLKIFNSKGKVISSLGLWQVGFPYGARYYSKVPGGKGHTARQLYSAAVKGGSKSILIEGKGGKCIRVDNPLEEQGSIFT